MVKENYLVTGAMGCIGAWILYHLVQQGQGVVSFDISENRQRVNLLLAESEQDSIIFEQGDLTNKEQIEETIKRHQITRIIHLGALQVPFCRENPILGAQVNVMGTLNIFEAARNCNLSHVVYASSIAVYGKPDEYEPGLIQADAPLNPHTLYGGYKECNEQNARMYARDYGVNSTALRPYIVYGVGRDQGMTSDPTKAMLAAARGESYEIAFAGTTQFQLASDVALQFIEAAKHPLDGAHVYNLGGELLSMEQIVSVIKEIAPDADITFKTQLLPFPIGFDDSALRRDMPTVYETPFKEGVRQIIDHFKLALDRGHLMRN